MSDLLDFLKSLPVVITAIAGLVTAIAGLLISYQKTKNNDDPKLSASEGSKEDLYKDSFSTNILSSEWQVISGQWHVSNGVLKGKGSHAGSSGREWGAITLSKGLPENISISYRTRVMEGALSELMLNLSNNKYIRVYLYVDNQTVHIGQGFFYNTNNYGTDKALVSNIGGGRTLNEHEFYLMREHWYNIDVISNNNHYAVKIGGHSILEYHDKRKELNSNGSIGFITNGSIEICDVRILKK